MANSMHSNGMPHTNNMMKYGTRKAPEHTETNATNLV